MSSFLGFSSKPDPERAIVDIEIAFYFNVFIGMDFLGDFSHMEGMEKTVEPYTWNEGGRNFSPLQFPFESPAKYGQVTFRWGMLSRTALYDWMDAVEVGRAFRKQVFVLQLTRDRTPLRLMRLASAWPVSWKGTDLDSTESKYAVEELTLVYDNLNLMVNRILTVERLLANSGSSDSTTTASYKAGLAQSNADLQADEAAANQTESDTPEYEEEEEAADTDVKSDVAAEDDTDEYEAPPAFDRDEAETAAAGDAASDSSDDYTPPPAFSRGDDSASSSDSSSSSDSTDDDYTPPPAFTRDDESGGSTT